LSGKLRRHSSVFSSRLKTNSDGTDVTSAGKLLQTRAAATEKERSPMVERRVTGTSSAAIYVTWRHLPSMVAV